MSPLKRMAEDLVNLKGWLAVGLWCLIRDVYFAVCDLDGNDSSSGGCVSLSVFLGHWD